MTPRRFLSSTQSDHRVQPFWLEYAFPSSRFANRKRKAIIDSKARIMLLLQPAP